MRNDDHLIFENYFKKLSEGKASPSNFSGQPVKPVGSFANAPIPKGYDAMQNMINKKLAAKKGKSEDAEDHCHAAEIEHCKCNGCPEYIANQSESEDAEGLPDSIEAKRKARKNIGEVRTEDAEDLNVDPADWGDSYQEVKGLIDQLLSYGLDKSILSGILQYAEEVGYTGESVDNLIKLIQHFNQKGVQDS
jgi:hypothetical protein